MSIVAWTICITGLYRVVNGWDGWCEDTKTTTHNFDLLRQEGQTTVFQHPPLVSEM